MRDNQSVSTDALRTRLRTLLDDVAYGHQHINVSRYGKPAAVLVDVSWYETRQDPEADLGKVHHVSERSSRHYEPPVSIAQARARVLSQLDHMKMACDDGIDVRYAEMCLREAVDDYCEFAATGEVRESD